MSRAITCDVILSGIRTRSDGSISLTLATPELDGEGIAAFAGLRNRNLKILIQPVDEAPAELKEIKGEFDRKTKSQRLRAVLFIEFQGRKSEGVVFEDYYNREMERIIEARKQNLPPF